METASDNLFYELLLLLFCFQLLNTLRPWHFCTHSFRAFQPLSSFPFLFFPIPFKFRNWWWKPVQGETWNSCWIILYHPKLLGVWSQVREGGGGGDGGLGSWRHIGGPHTSWLDPCGRMPAWSAGLWCLSCRNSLHRTQTHFSRRRLLNPFVLQYLSPRWLFLSAQITFCRAPMLYNLSE